LTQSITTTRQAFPAKLANIVQSQFQGFARADMTAYTYEKAKSDFHGAKMDLTIFNGDGKVVLNGRDFGDRTYFWQP
jgi:hypothetical protein